MKNTKRQVTVKITDGNSEWPEPFMVTSAETAIDEVQEVLDSFNKHRNQNNHRKIVELTNISVSIQYQDVSKDLLRDLKKTEQRHITFDSIHILRKKNLVSNSDGSDTYECEVCKLTGKRSGLTSSGISVKAPLGKILHCSDWDEFLNKQGKK